MFRRINNALVNCPDELYTFIFGAGGHASEVFGELSFLPSKPRVVAFVQDMAEKNQQFQGLPVLSLTEVDTQLPCASVAIGDPKTRELIVRKLEALGIDDYLTIVSPDVRLHSSVTIGAGSLLCRGVIPTVDISIGQHVHINRMSTISHGVKIDDFVTISPGVLIAGNVTIEKGAFIGIGAAISNGTAENPIVIGSESVVAAGAVVTKSVPARSMVAGVPAVIKKQW